MHATDCKTIVKDNKALNLTVMNHLMSEYDSFPPCFGPVGRCNIMSINSVYGLNDWWIRLPGKVEFAWTHDYDAMPAIICLDLVLFLTDKMRLNGLHYEHITTWLQSSAASVAEERRRLSIFLCGPG